MMTSSEVIMPRSPWLASAGWTKNAGVPVDERVAAILWPMWPDLPRPLTMTRPRAAVIMETAAMKVRPRPFAIAALRAVMPPVSAPRVRNAQAISAWSRSLVGCALLRNTCRSPQQRLDLVSQRRSDIVARQRISDVGGEEADLAAAIEAAAFKFEPVERLLQREPDHRVGELDFSARAAALVRQNFENLWLQDISSGDDKVRGRMLARRLLDHPRDLESLALRFSDPHHAVHMNAIHRHFFDRNDIGIVGEPSAGIQHLCQAAALRLHQHIRQHQGERLVADEFARAPYRMAEPQRLLLAGEAGLSGARQIARQKFQLGAAIALRQGQFELELPVEMVLDDAFVAAGDENEVLDAGLTGFIHHVLNQRTVDDRQHFLRHRLRGGQKTCTKAGDRQDGFTDGLHKGCAGNTEVDRTCNCSNGHLRGQMGITSGNNCGIPEATAKNILIGSTFGIGYIELERDSMR